MIRAIGYRLIDPLRRDSEPDDLTGSTGSFPMYPKTCALTFLLYLPIAAFAQSSGKAELARCLSGGTNCDYELIADAYDGIVPTTMARPNTTGEGLLLFTTCLALRGPDRMSYSSERTLALAKTLLSRGICEGDINNLYYRPLD